jgi:flavin-dependent dehydrogenase
MHDLVVVGGGPAGLVTALNGARAGLDVVLFERRAGVLDKACGEGLMPGALHALQRLGVDPPGHDLAGITYRDTSRSARAAFRAGPGRGVRRTALHAALRDALADAGVPVCERAVTEVVQRNGCVEAGGVRARYLAAADGLHSPLRRDAGLIAASRSDPARWGLRQHFAVDAWTDDVEVTWADGCEAYVTPVADGLVGVAILSSSRGDFDAHLRHFPLLRGRLKGAQAVSPVRGAGPLRQRSRARTAGRVLLVGDAAGYVDALTGEGLAVSFAAATALIDCVVRDRPQDYDRAWARLSRRSRWLTSGLLWARQRSVLAGRIVPAAAHMPRVFSAAVDQLAQ